MKVEGSRGAGAGVLGRFLSSTQYTRPVDMKKLRFVFSAVNAYSRARNKDFESIRVLDVACGTGNITFPLASLGCTVTAFDTDENAVGCVQARIDEEGIENLTVSVDNGYTFDYGEKYDIVVASEVFEHVLEPSRFAANIRKSMTAGSHIVVTTPNGYGPWELSNRLNPRLLLRRQNRLRKLLGKQPYVKASGDEHCQYFTKKGLIDLFTELSFQPIKFAKSDSIFSISRRFRNSSFFGGLDTQLADLLPFWISSGWYFVFELRDTAPI